ncbi:MAG TPA: crosslink repair DNA glycosylase YcaQ family protein [Terriglobales bacterium]|nr:crosslink repair DNA glycosylase YcaQ family protein [Terriglobales bacterium]
MKTVVRMLTSFSLQQALAFRLTRHHLCSEKPAKLWILAADSCGIQAQLFSAAELSLWARSHKLKRTEIHASLWKDRTLIKTSCMRGTLHLLAASDYPIYMRALEKSRMRHMRSVMSRWGVTPAEGDAVTEAIAEALHPGPLTRSELTARAMELGIVQRNAKPFFISGWWGVVRQAIVQGLICFGPDRGQETSYVRVDQWLPGLASITAEEAGPLLVRRYLRVRSGRVVRLRALERHVNA